MHEIKIKLPITQIKRIAIGLIVLIIAWNFYKTLHTGNNPDMEKINVRLDSLTKVVKKQNELYNKKLDSFQNFKDQSEERIDSFIRVQKWHNYKFKEAIQSRSKNRIDYEKNKDSVTRSASAIGNSIRSNIK